MNFSEGYKSQRKKQLVISIEGDKEEIKKDTLLLAASAFFVGAGAMGVYFLGPEVFDKILKWNSNEITMEFKSALLLKAKAGLLGTSVISIIRGIQAAVTFMKSLIGDVQDLKEDKSELANLDEEGLKL